MAHLKKSLLTLFIGEIALLSEFVLHQSGLAFIIVAFTGGILAFVMFLEMIKTLCSGGYGVDILTITTILTTLAVKEYWTSLMILIMLTDGDSLEDYANKRAGKELRSLLDNTPGVTRRFEEGRWQGIVIDEIDVDDQLLVKPGELVSVDGQVIKGESSVNESSLTGGFRPETGKPGNQIMSGSSSKDGSIQMVTGKRAVDNQYQMIVKLVEESKEKPARFVRLVDRYMAPFTSITYLIGGTSWWFSKDPLRFTEVLIVTSPCPLILAAPIALAAGMSHSSKNGIVVKIGTAIEKLARTRTTTFNKTGTFTKGILEVETIQPINGMRKEELLMYAASAEQESSHILVRSLMNNVKDNQLYPVSQLKEVTGQGVQAMVNDHDVKIGHAPFVSVEEIETSETVTYVAIDRSLAGTILFSDQIRSEAVRTIKELRSLDAKNLTIITGDESTVTQAITEEVKLDSVHAHCLSQDKLAILKRIPKDRQPVAMTGDGVNDAPVLAVAGIGVAMGAHGPTAASESVDAVILRDDLLRIVKVVVISKNTMRIARQSVLIGIFICIFLVLIVSTGLVPTLFRAVL